MTFNHLTIQIYLIFLEKLEIFFSTQDFPQFIADQSEVHLMEFNNSKALMTRDGIESKVSDT